MDEFWFWVSPSLWPSGPRIFDGVGPVSLELIGSTTFSSGVVRLAYRPVPGRQDGAGAEIAVPVTSRAVDASRDP
jgi:hypothetical protein